MHKEVIELAMPCCLIRMAGGTDEGDACRYIKLMAGLTLTLGLLMLMCNTWGLRALNRQVLPQATATACSMLQREVGMPLRSRIHM